MSDMSERRRVRRHTFQDHGVVRARVRPGRNVSLINLSSDGALLETAHRLLPGSSIELHLITSERQVEVRGRVLRCAVARLRASAVWYRGAIRFDRSLPWFVDDETVGYPIRGGEDRAGGEMRSHRPAWEDASRSLVG